MKHARAFTVDLSVHCPEAAVLWALNCTPENMCTPEVDSGQRTGDGREERPARGDVFVFSWISILQTLYGLCTDSCRPWDSLFSVRSTPDCSPKYRETRKRLF